MSRSKLPPLGLALLVLALAFVPLASSATQTCTPDPGEAVCFGDSGNDPYALCDGRWADAYEWYTGSHWVNVCVGYDGVVRVLACSGVVQQCYEWTVPLP